MVSARVPDNLHIPGRQASGASRGARRHRPGDLAAVLVLLALAATAPVLAQDPTAVLVGDVTTSEGLPLPGAQIHLVGETLGTLSGPSGSYSLSGIPLGPHLVQVVLIGYRTNQLAVDFQEVGPFRYDVRLEIEPVALEALEVEGEASPLSPAMQGFAERQARGDGYFYVREDIQKMQARQFTDILRRVPGARVQNVNSPFGHGAVVQLTRTTGLTRSCPILYYMNGVPFRIPGENGINDYVMPEDVAAVEVYTGTSNIPSRFNSGPNNSRCGVVVIWTRNGRDGGGAA